MMLVVAIPIGIIPPSCSFALALEAVTNLYGFNPLDLEKLSKLPYGPNHA
jgi:hypothetical protein